MNGVNPGDRVWIFRGESDARLPELAWRNIGKTLRVIREAHPDECAPGDGPCWYVEALEPCICTKSGERMPTGDHGVVLKSCVKPLRDPDVHEDPIELLKELSA